MMKPKTYFAVTLVVFLIVGTAHLLRILYNWDMHIAGWQVPMSVSWAAVVILALLSYHACTLETKRK